MEVKTIQITHPPKHHFFGFHDLAAWNSIGDKILSLEVDVINRPPFPQELAGVGYIDENSNYIKLGTTSTFNFPQGARMQWISDSNQFIVNNIRKDVFACDVYDAEADKMIASYAFPCHQLHKNGKTTFSINYARLHRLGAYGYPGIEDFTKGDSIPGNDGIYSGDLKSNKNELLISIEDVANFPEKLNNKSYGHHYLTHLLLNPSNNRLAFLHRYPLPDGGEITRLMSIGTDGTELRCLGSGFLSHFDWKDDQTIFIFGRVNSALDAFRSNPLISIPIIAYAARMGKKFLQNLVKQKASINSGFVMIKDATKTEYSKVAEGVLTADGHPMFCPTNRDWIINDTYPNEEGIRTLMLYNFSENKRIDIGKYAMIFDKPDLTLSEEYFKGVEPILLKNIGEKNLAFTRSGLHCDLHPRWDKKGRKVAFDSIHDGTRQVYMIDFESLKIL